MLMLTLSYRANGGITELCYGCPSEPSDLIITFPPLPPVVARPPATPKGGQESLAEAGVHEAVDDGVDTGWGIGQQLNKGDGSSGKSILGWLLIESLPGVGRVQRHPAYEEHGNYNDQHSYHSFLSNELGLWGVAPWTVCLDGAWGGQSRKFHSRGLLWDLDVTSITLIVARRQCTIQPILYACKRRSEDKEGVQSIDSVFTKVIDVISV